MDYIKVIENLGKEVAEFMLKYGDTYEFRDCYEDYGNDSFDETFITETIKTLYDNVKAKMMALHLKQYYVENVEIYGEEDEKMISKANELYYRIIEL